MDSCKSRTATFQRRVPPSPWHQETTLETLQLVFDINLMRMIIWFKSNIAFSFFFFPLEEQFVPSEIKKAFPAHPRILCALASVSTNKYNEGLVLNALFMLNTFSVFLNPTALATQFQSDQISNCRPVISVYNTYASFLKE